MNQKWNLRASFNWRLLLHLALALRLTSEDGEGELSVVEAATAILVVDVEKGPQLVLRVVHAGLLEHSLELVEVDCASVHDVEVLEHLDEAGSVG